MAPEDGLRRRADCAEMQGFSPRVAVRCNADDRQGLERLCREITGPAVAYKRVQCDASGQVVLKLKTPWRDCTTHLVSRRWSSCSVGCRGAALALAFAKLASRL